MHQHFPLAEMSSKCFGIERGQVETSKVASCGRPFRAMYDLLHSMDPNVQSLCRMTKTITVLVRYPFVMSYSPQGVLISKCDIYMM